MSTRDNILSRSAWAGYVFAVFAAGAAVAVRWGTERLTGQQISLPLCGFAAVIVSIWRAGAGAGLTAAVLTSAWYLLLFHGAGGWINGVIYAGEAAAVCICRRSLSLARDEATAGEDWRLGLVETSADGIWMVEADGVISYANPRIADILGCAADRVMGRNVEDFLFPENLVTERVRSESRRAGVREQFDRRLRRADGTEVWTLASVTPVRHRGQNRFGALTMMTDITERKKAEQALRLSERKFRELFENILEGVYQTAPDGRILAANPELLRMLGFTNQDELNVIGAVRDTFADPDVHQALRERLNRDGSYSNVEFELRTRDHRMITVRENARVVRDENGEVLYYEGTLTDITEQIRLEKQLRQAQKMEALGRLAGGIAQDFHSIGVVMADRLRQALDILSTESAARPHLEAAARAARSASALTRQILDFSQRQAVGQETFDLNSVVRRLEPELRRLVEPEHSLTLSLSADPAPVLADPGHMRQIVSSLLIHARDFGAGAKKIGIVSNVEEAGPGIAAGTVATLVIQSEAGEGPGDDARTSAEMATTQAILTQYGGILTVTGEPGGAGKTASVRYSLSLPLAADAAQEEAVRMQQAETAGSSATGAVVLLMEEEPLIRELSRDILERQGFRVLTAGNAGEAERMARGPQPVRVLITEWAAGGSSLGARLCELRPGMRILYVSGYSQTPPAFSTAPLPEGSAILQKPFSGDSLGRKIRQLLDRES